MYTKWLRYVLIGGIFLTLVIPFIIANGNLADIANWLFPVNAFFPFIVGKNFVFRILVEVMLGLYILLALREPRYRPRRSYVLWAVVIFTAWVGVATMFSVDPVKSFWSNFERMEGYITILHLLAYFLIAAAVINVEKLWTRYFQVSVGMSVLMGFYGIAQLAHAIPIDQGSTRIDGTLGNSAYLAGYMLFNIFFALVLLTRSWKNVSLRYTYIPVILFQIFILLETETRGTILGLFGGLAFAALYILWCAWRRESVNSSLKRWSLGYLAFLVLIFVVFLGIRNIPSVRNAPVIGRLASISFSDPTIQSRLMITGMVWQGFKDKPITGWGQDNFNFVFNKYYNPAMYADEQWFDRAHDVFLDWLMNAGAPGFLLFISLFALSGWAFIRSDLPITERAILLGLVVGYAIHDAAVFDNIVSYLGFFTLLALAHGLSARDVPRRLWYARPVGDNVMAVAAPIVAVAVIAGAWYLNGPGIAKAQTLLLALEPTNPQNGTSDPEQNLTYFKQALGGGPLGRQEVTEQLLQAAVSVDASSSVDPSVKQDYYNTALSAITALTIQRPHDARLELFFGSFLNQFGQTQQALQELQLANQDSPDKQQILFEIGVDTYLRVGDYTDAAAALKQAFDLDPSYDDARIYYAVALYYTGDTATADQLLMQRYGTVTPDNSLLVSAYYATKHYDRAEAILKSRVAANSTDLQSWVQLAGVQYGAGDKAGALATLKAAEAANPGSAAQINQLINEVETGKVTA